MTSPADCGTPIDGSAQFRRLIVQLGVAMVAAGDAVDVVEKSLRRIITG